MKPTTQILSQYIKHPTAQGVYLKHFFAGEDTDQQLNNLEIRIEPGCQIAAHIHEHSSEFYYVVRGSGLFLQDGEWEYVHEGEALLAPKGVEHGFQNPMHEALVLFSTFSPPIR